MRVPARFDRRSLVLWLLAAAIATALLVWELASRDPEPRPREQQAPGQIEIEIIE